MTGEADRVGATYVCTIVDNQRAANVVRLRKESNAADNDVKGRSRPSIKGNVGGDIECGEVGDFQGPVVLECSTQGGSEIGVV